MAFCNPQCINHGGKLLFKIGLLARYHMIIHADGNHSGSSPLRCCSLNLGLGKISNNMIAWCRTDANSRRSQTSAATDSLMLGVGIGGSGWLDAGSRAVRKAL